MEKDVPVIEFGVMEGLNSDASYGRLVEQSMVDWSCPTVPVWVPRQKFFAVVVGR